VADPEALVTDPAVKNRLRANGETAVARGVFGVPTFVTADGELFWGEDATPMLLDHLSGAPVMRSPEMLRADDLPVAKARPR
jgi:2-hydroxychromene-2-carboxylate isomerase